MKNWLFASLALVQIAAPVFPHAEIANSRIQATLHLPDAQAGYYRGTRFDWPGSVASLKWNGHEPGKSFSWRITYEFYQVSSAASRLAPDAAASPLDSALNFFTETRQ